uniref:Uncharacterized protein n=1 Tax=Eptatretus burgeri TaxID=7764 RepID=A0A8C4QT76_EPTBU
MSPQQMSQAPGFMMPPTSGIPLHAGMMGALPTMSYGGQIVVPVSSHALPMQGTVSMGMVTTGAMFLPQQQFYSTRPPPPPYIASQQYVKFSKKILQNKASFNVLLIFLFKSCFIKFMFAVVVYGREQLTHSCYSCNSFCFMWRLMVDEQHKIIEQHKKREEKERKRRQFEEQKQKLQMMSSAKTKVMQMTAVSCCCFVFLCLIQQYLSTWLFGIFIDCSLVLNFSRSHHLCLSFYKPTVWSFIPLVLLFSLCFG